MSNYKLTSEGEEFLKNPRWNRSGKIGTPYFRKLVLIYLFIEKDRYIPKEFKTFVESLSLLDSADTDYMNTIPYSVWKHHIDAAKQGLLPIIEKNSDRSFSIKEKCISQALGEISNYVEIENKILPEYPQDQVSLPNRVPTTIIRTVRDTNLSHRIKQERNYKCQVCGIRLEISQSSYAEAHHVKPLGHNGPDIESNLLVLCPNHHVLFDHGAVGILPSDSATITDSSGKSISTLSPPLPDIEFIEYHYENIFRKLIK